MPIALITGCNKGIGLELTRQYLKEGWYVHATVRKPEFAFELNELLASRKEYLTVHKMDVTNHGERQNLAKQLTGMPIDLLVNNAGAWGQVGSNFENTDEVMWLEGFRVNTIAPMLMMQTFADNIALSKRKLIANMSSKMGSIDDNGSGSSYVYRSSKAALNMVSKSAAIDLEEKGVTVVILHPGWVRTDMGGPYGEISVQESARQLRTILSKITLADSGKFFDIDGSIIPW